MIHFASLVATIIAAVVALASLAAAQVSDGSDGAFNPGANMNFNLNLVHTDGVFNFTTINSIDSSGRRRAISTRSPNASGRRRYAGRSWLSLIIGFSS